MLLPMHFGESTSECTIRVTCFDSDKSYNIYLHGKKNCKNTYRVNYSCSLLSPLKTKRVNLKHCNMISKKTIKGYRVFT